MAEKLSPRLRFAPSPTGYMHLGVARTALFNWIYARSVGGRLILRIEDTDTERSQADVIQDILDLTEWLGIDFDEGPYFQSERLKAHRDAVEELLQSGDAYLCDSENKEVAGSQLEEGLAVRFRIADKGEVGFLDEVRGEVSFQCQDLEDFVIWRSNGTPTFLLCNAVDDAEMGITHAIRGEDLLSSTPKVLLLFKALGLQPPVYAHLPLLVNEARQKLSKRRDDVSLGDWRARGYLPLAMANYLALLGWGPPDGVEIRPMQEIIQLFKLADIGHAPAFFDAQKLEHFNAVYIRNLPIEDFVELARPWLESVFVEAADSSEANDRFLAIAPDIQSKIRTLSDIPRFVDWLFLKEPELDLEALKSLAVADEILKKARAAYEEVEWEASAVHQATKDLKVKGELPLSKTQMPIRVAITGRKVGPPLFSSMVLLERAEILRRLDRAIKLVNS